MMQPIEPDQVNYGRDELAARSRRVTGDPYRKFSFRDTEVCGNLDCPNRPESGPFVLVILGEGKIVDGHRVFRLFVCSPCAAALEEIAPVRSGRE